jgi:hypothetical protein
MTFLDTFQVTAIFMFSVYLVSLISFAYTERLTNHVHRLEDSLVNTHKSKLLSEKIGIEKMALKKNDFYEYFFISLIVAFVAYSLACFHLTKQSNNKPWIELGKWTMFTNFGKYHYEITSEVSIDGTWSKVDMLKLFSSIWDSGPRYHRSIVWNSSKRLKMLAASICVRAEGPAKKVRIYREYWPIKLGVPASERGVVKKRTLLHWECDMPFYSPNGTQVTS